jgi:hypothetical protein
MAFRGHIRVFVIATIVWAGFWIAGLPSYYQQYSKLEMICFDSLVLIPIAGIAYFVLRRVPPAKRLTIALWLAFYFTVPLGHGMQFISRYWYLSVYYAIPWVLLPPMAFLLNRMRSGKMENSNAT